MFKLPICLASMSVILLNGILEASEKFQKDREAILAMAGEFEVDFQFMETVAIDQSYELKKLQR